MTSRPSLLAAAPDELDHFDLIALADRLGLPLRPWNDLLIVFHGHTLMGKLKARKQLGECYRRLDLEGLAVDDDVHPHPIIDAGRGLWDADREWAAPRERCCVSHPRASEPILRKI